MNNKLDFNLDTVFYSPEEDRLFLADFRLKYLYKIVGIIYIGEF